MTDLLFEQKLRAAKPESEARIVARARTSTALRDLDSQRQGQLLRFLQEAKLISGDKPVIDLSYANLRYADLSDTDLSDTDRTRARFCQTKMPDGSENNQDCSQKQSP